MVHGVPVVVALKARQGELRALENEPAGSPVVPMVELLDSLRAEGGRLLKPLVTAAATLAARGTPLWVDPSRLSPAGPLAGEPGGALEFLDNAIENAWQPDLFSPDSPALVPVVTEACTAEDLARVGRLVDHHPRDVVLRLRRPEMPAADLRALLARVLRVRGVGEQSLRVVVDAGYLDGSSTELPDAVAGTVDRLRHMVSPRSLTLLSGSVPRTRDDHGTTERQRAELALWQRVRAGTGRADLGYGDYGLVHPALPKAGSRPRSPHPYLLYTLDDRTVSLRRKIPKGASPGTAAMLFAELAGELAGRPDYAGPEFSWGDRRIRECGSPDAPGEGSVSGWLAMATSHHLAQLARQAA